VAIDQSSLSPTRHVLLLLATFCQLHICVRSSWGWYQASGTFSWGRAGSSPFPHWRRHSRYSWYVQTVLYNYGDTVVSLSLLTHKTALECTKFVFGRGSTPGPCWRAYSAPPGLFSWFKGLLLRGGEGERKREGERLTPLFANSWIRSCKLGLRSGPLKIPDCN